MIDLIKQYTYPIVAIILLSISGYVYYLKVSLDFADNKIEKQEILINEKQKELDLTIESIEANQKILDAKARAEATIKANKDSLVKTQTKLKEAIKNRGEINEVSNDNFTTFSF